MTDYGHPCGKDQDCTLPNIHCAYPNCYKGKQQATRTTDADIDRAIRDACGFHRSTVLMDSHRASYRAGYAAGRAAGQAERAEAALRQWETWGIAEIAVRNQSVMEYMEHWEGRAKRAEERLAVYNSGGFADADALAAKFIDLTRDRDKALRHVVRLTEAINRLHEVARGEHEASYHDICDIVNAALKDKP